VISNVFCTVYISSNFCATVGGQYVTFIQHMLVEAAQSLIFQCLAHNIIAKVQALPKELLSQNGGHNEHNVT
jgi:hypothetical protein